MTRDLKKKSIYGRNIGSVGEGSNKEEMKDWCQENSVEQGSGGHLKNNRKMGYAGEGRDSVLVVS